MSRKKLYECAHLSVKKVNVIVICAMKHAIAYKDNLMYSGKLNARELSITYHWNRINCEQNMKLALKPST